jgi:two-component system phosphate regulon sensor histidine kinase PhoR
MAEQGELSRRSYWTRLDPVAGVVATATVVLAALALAGALHVGLALLAVAVLVATGWLLKRQSSRYQAAPGLLAPLSAQGQGALLDSILNGLPDAVVALHQDGVVVSYNEHARRLAPALRRGGPASVALRMPALVEAMRQAALTGSEQTAEISERGPIDRWFEAHVIPIGDGADPGERLMLVSMRDLTPVRQSEAMRADFVANASHELRTPLASLSGFIETLQGPAKDDAAARERFLAIMKGQATRMARLIDDLLSLSRIERTAHIRPDTVIDLRQVIYQVVDALQMLARERQMEVTIESADAPLHIVGDRDEVFRVFENLIENALKYGASGKRVRVAIERREQQGRSGEAIVAVQDFGPGIAPDHLPRLTERFYRVDVSQSRAEGGTGLGLALVKHILNRHQGRLLVESALNAGSTFSVHLPLSTGPAGPASE